MSRVILSIIVSYLIGSFPSAYILGRVFKAVDIRGRGSGNVGATNAFRVLGPVFGIVALILDIFKGLICPTLIANWLGNAESISHGLALRLILGICAVCGHNWPIFLRFRGGKGVAASLGVIFGLAIIITPLRMILLFVILSWILIFLISGFVSLSSILAALLLPVFSLIFKIPRELFILNIGLSIFIILRHKSNIHRLLHKEENRFYPLKSLKSRLFKD